MNAEGFLGWLNAQLDEYERTQIVDLKVLCGVRISQEALVMALMCIRRRLGGTARYLSRRICEPLRCLKNAAWHTRVEQFALRAACITDPKDAIYVAAVLKPEAGTCHIRCIMRLTKAYRYIIETDANDRFELWNNEWCESSRVRRHARKLRGTYADAELFDILKDAVDQLL
ncbi:MAG: hypothetical protein ACPGR8_06320 [Limisphaerales bacterium]